MLKKPGNINMKCATEKPLTGNIWHSLIYCKFKVMQATSKHFSRSIFNMEHTKASYLPPQIDNDPTHTQHPAVCGCVCAWIRPGISAWEKKKDAEGRKGGWGESLILHFVHVVSGRQLTFSADTLGWVTTMKWGPFQRTTWKSAMCFKVVQLDYPFHFCTCVQSRDI